jgi:VanZ family protein
MRHRSVRLPRLLLVSLFWTACLAVGVLALLPATLPLPSTGWDKANHGLAFGALGLLGARCWPQARAVVLLGLVAYGGAIEVAQSFTPTREGEWLDWVADATGLLMAAVLWAKSVDTRHKTGHPRPLATPAPQNFTRP